MHINISFTDPGLSKITNNFVELVKANQDNKTFCLLISAILFTVLLILFLKNYYKNNSGTMKNGCANFSKEYEKGQKIFNEEAKKREAEKEKNRQITCLRCETKYLASRYHCPDCGEPNHEYQYTYITKSKINIKEIGSILKTGIIVVLIFFIVKYFTI